ncbi:MAG: ABC transporter ATP-binding protein [Clostridia bacterium]
MNEVLEIEHLTKSYDGKTVLDDLSISVKKGTVFGLLGANGAGKSTTIGCTLGTEKADDGNVYLFGEKRGKNRSLFEKIGVQFQEGDYQNEIKVKELCEETSCLYRNPVDWLSLCCRFGIEEKIHSRVKNLSGGERQKLFIILALIPGPELVFLDELTTGLDVLSRREVWKILSELKDQGLTIFLTSHFMDEVEALCDEICILKKGRAVFRGTTREAKELCRCEQFTDAYLKLSGDEVVS